MIGRIVVGRRRRIPRLGHLGGLWGGMVVVVQVRCFGWRHVQRWRMGKSWIANSFALEMRVTNFLHAHERLRAFLCDMQLKIREVISRSKCRMSGEMCSRERQEEQLSWRTG